KNALYGPSVVVTCILFLKLRENVLIKCFLRDGQRETFSNAGIYDGSKFCIYPIFFLIVPMTERLVARLWLCDKLSHAENIESFFSSNFIPIAHKFAPLLLGGDIAGSDGNRSTAVRAAIVKVEFYFKHSKPPRKASPREHGRNVGVGAILTFVARHCTLLVSYRKNQLARPTPARMLRAISASSRIL